MSASSKHNLPAVLSSIAGRETELAELADLLTQSRLLTLTGAPGIGKSRLAVELAIRCEGAFEGGAWFVELAPVRDAARVPAAVADALSAGEQPGQDVPTRLAARIADRSTLLVLDNCEHMVGACAQLAADLLERCLGLRVVVTSREALSVAGETVTRVGPLGVPGEDEPSTIEHAAVDLFVQRARAVQPGFRLTGYVAPQVAEICRRLDGIPLAIELAAARVKILTPHEIARRLDDRFALLTSGARSDLPHHRTLQAALDWSHDLLSHPERRLLRRLSVFAGGWCLEAAETVCADDELDRAEILDTLDRLVSRSLVAADTANGQRARYRVLETIRVYGADRLRDAGETARLRESHARFYLDLAESAEPELTGPDQQRWLERLDTDRENLRSALEWSLGHAHGEWALRQAGALTLFWRVRCHFTEGRELLQAALASSNGGARNGSSTGAENSTAHATTAPLKAKALWGAGFMTMMAGDPDAAVPLLEESFALSSELGDRTVQARALLILGNCGQLRHEEGADEALKRSAALAQEADDTWCRAHALGMAGFGHALREDDVAARPLLDQCVAVAREAEDKQSLRLGLLGLGIVASGQGDHRAAGPLFEECLEIVDDLGEDYHRATVMRYLGQSAFARGDLPRASALLDASVSAYRETGPPDALIRPLVVRARVARAEADQTKARAALDEAAALTRRAADPRADSEVAEALGDLALEEGRHDDARRLLGQALDEARSGNSARIEARALHGLGLLARTEGSPKRAAVLHNEALELQREMRDARSIVSSLDAVAGLAVNANRHEDAALLFGASDSASDARGYVRPPWEANRRRADLDTLGQLLDADRLKALMTRGGRLTLDEAVEKASKGRGPRGRPGTGWSSLTQAEQRVARLVGDGYTNPEIAERLVVSPETVKSHLSNVFRKLGITGRRELVGEVAGRGFSADRG